MPRATKRKIQAAYRIQSMWRKRKRRKVYRRRRPLALKLHNFVERNTLESEIQVSQTEADAVGLFRTFCLNDVRQVSSYSDIFEFYKIDKVVVTFRYKTGGLQPARNDYQSGEKQHALTNEVNPLLIFKVDHNDVTNQTINELKDSMKTHKKMLTNNSPEFSITLKPALQEQIYKSAVTTAYAPKWGQWLPMADVTAPHFGLKAFAVGCNDSNNINGKILVTYKTYFTCKNND